MPVLVMLTESKVAKPVVACLTRVPTSPGAGFMFKVMLESSLV